MLKELQEIITKNNYIEKTKESFWKTFKNYQVECLEEFNEVFCPYRAERMNIIANDVSFLVHNWPDEDYCCIVINLTIEYNDEIVGYYDVHYTLDGDVDDDFFVIY
ncbi:MAG: hypothetical protein NC347_05165 [Clostridium sp.]|nr:hypothetical protein [Clostridium sp.]